MSKRIVWLDGVKGLACIGVLFHHFTLAFLPATYYGDMHLTKMRGIDAYMAQSPFSWFMNGNYMVALFCLISALVLGLKVMDMTDKKELGNVILKRYPRLMLPIAPIILFVYIMLQQGWFRHLDIVPVTQSPWLGSYYLNKVPFKRCMESLFVTTWFSTDSTFSNAFWMLGYLLFGSYLAIVLSTFSWKLKKGALGVVYVFCAILYVRVNTLSLAFVFGVLLAYCYKYLKNMFGHSFIGICSLLIGIFLGGYPSGVMPGNIYRYFNCLPSEILTYQFWHIVGAFFTVYGICNIECLKKFLQKKTFKTLGKLSYSIYIIHIPFLFSVSCYIFKMLMMAEMSYVERVSMVFLISILGIIGIAYLYQHYIETLCEKILNKLMNIIVVQNEDGKW